MVDRKEFIKFFLIDSIKNIQQINGHHYLSFGLISQGIEFLGCCLDDKGYFKEKLSRERFENAIKELFPQKYQQFNIKDGQYYLYRDLRCGLLHGCLPKPSIELIRRSEIINFTNHLEIKNIRGKETLVLVSEELFNDFENACKEIINRIDKGKISNGNLLVTEP
ncbi:MAG: hypothetical protein WC349_03470 [Patescibacteria group bacterium]|jgi:hypothetical protein